MFNGPRDLQFFIKIPCGTSAVYTNDLKIDIKWTSCLFQVLKNTYEQMDKLAELDIPGKYKEIQKILLVWSHLFIVIFFILATLSNYFGFLSLIRFIKNNLTLKEMREIRKQDEPKVEDLVVIITK